jgi:hypothetical protein
MSTFTARFHRSQKQKISDDAVDKLIGSQLAKFGTDLYELVVDKEEYVKLVANGEITKEYLNFLCPFEAAYITANLATRIKLKDSATFFQKRRKARLVTQLNDLIAELHSHLKQELLFGMSYKHLTVSDYEDLTTILEPAFKTLLNDGITAFQVTINLTYLIRLGVQMSTENRTKIAIMYGKSSHLENLYPEYFSKILAILKELAGTQ